MFFFEFAKYIVLMRESFAKVGYHENNYHCIHYSLLRATTSCRPGVRQENGTAHFPFIGGSQASEGEASPQPNTMVLNHILALAVGAA